MKLTKWEGFLFWFGLGFNNNKRKREDKLWRQVPKVRSYGQPDGGQGDEVIF